MLGESPAKASHSCALSAFAGRALPFPRAGSPRGVFLRGDRGRHNTQGDWPVYGSDKASTKYTPLDGITAANFANLTIAWQWQSVDQPILDADTTIWTGRYEATPLASTGCSTPPHRCIRPSPSMERPARPCGPSIPECGEKEPLRTSDSSIAASRTGSPGRVGPPDLWNRWGLAVRTGSRNRSADSRIRRQRPHRSDPGASSSDQARALRDNVAPDDLPRQADRGLLHLRPDARLPAATGRRAGAGPGDRPDPMDLRVHSARRIRRRELLGGQLLADLRQCQRMDLHELRRGARHGLPPIQHADQRLLRWWPAGRQPLRRVGRGASRGDRRESLALSGRASWPLGL